MVTGKFKRKGIKATISSCQVSYLEWILLFGALINAVINLRIQKAENIFKGKEQTRLMCKCTGLLEGVKCVHCMPKALCWHILCCTSKSLNVKIRAKTCSSQLILCNSTETKIK